MDASEHSLSRPSSFKRSFDELDAGESSNSPLGIALVVGGEDASRNDRTKRPRSENDSSSHPSASTTHISVDIDIHVSAHSATSSSTFPAARNLTEANAHPTSLNGHPLRLHHGSDSARDVVMSNSTLTHHSNELLSHSFFNRPSPFSPPPESRSHPSAGPPGEQSLPNAHQPIVHEPSTPQSDPEERIAAAVFAPLQVPSPPPRHVASSSGSISNESTSEDRYRVSMERFNTFDGHIAVLRNPNLAPQDVAGPSHVPDPIRAHFDIEPSPSTQAGVDEDSWFEHDPSSGHPVSSLVPNQATSVAPVERMGYPRATDISHNLSYSELLNQANTRRRRIFSFAAGLSERSQATRRPPPWLVSSATTGPRTGATAPPEIAALRTTSNPQRDLQEISAREANRGQESLSHERPWNQESLSFLNSSQMRRSEPAESRGLQNLWRLSYPPSPDLPTGVETEPAPLSSSSRSRTNTAEEEAEVAWLFNQMEDQYRLATEDPLTHAPYRPRSPPHVSRSFNPASSETYPYPGLGNHNSPTSTPSSRIPPLSSGVRQHIPRISLLTDETRDESYYFWNGPRPRQPATTPTSNWYQVNPEREPEQQYASRYGGDTRDRTSEAAPREGGAEPLYAHLRRPHEAINISAGRDSSRTLQAQTEDIPTPDSGIPTAGPYSLTWPYDVAPPYTWRFPTPLPDRTDRLYGLPDTQLRSTSRDTSRREESTPSWQARTTSEHLQRELEARARLGAYHSAVSRFPSRLPTLLGSTPSDHSSWAYAAGPPWPSSGPSAEEEEVEALLSSSRVDLARRAPAAASYVPRTRSPTRRSSRTLPPVAHSVREAIGRTREEEPGERARPHGHSPLALEPRPAAQPSAPPSSPTSVRNGPDTTAATTSLYDLGRRPDDRPAPRSSTRSTRRTFTGDSSIATTASQVTLPAIQTTRRSSINLDDYHDGPFRASLARTERIRREREELGRRAAARQELERASELFRSGASTATSVAADGVWPPRDNVTYPSTTGHFSRYASATRLDRTSSRSHQLRPSQSQPRRSSQEDQRELHDSVTRRLRQPPARLVGSESTWDSNSHSLPALRPDANPSSNAARQQHLTSAFHAQREASARHNNARSNWGDIDEPPQPSSTDILPWRPRRLPRFGLSTLVDDWSFTSSSRSQPQTQPQRRGRFVGAWRRNERDGVPGLRVRMFGDYIRDEDFDTSYEGLLHLTSMIGEARPRGTPRDAIDALPTGSHGEWAAPGSEERCPICLDDYVPSDRVMKIPACSHWFHKGCLEQWLGTATTCPVCRGRVGSGAGSGIEESMFHRGRRSTASSAAADGSAASGGGGDPSSGPAGNSSDEGHDEDDSDSDEDAEYIIRSLGRYGNRRDRSL